jgi:hypothetical protein
MAAPIFVRFVARLVVLGILASVAGCAAATPMRVCSSNEFKTSCTHWEEIK